MEFIGKGLVMCC